MKNIIAFIVLLSSFVCFVYEVEGSDSPKTAQYHIEQGNNFLISDRPFAAIEEFKKAIAKGTSDPVLYRNYAIVLYDLGFLDEAIVNLKKALSLSPYANSFQMELGIIYLAKENYELALKQFVSVLDRNPGFANAYYYLGETYYRMKDYDTSWMYSQMAQNLRHKGKDLTEKLRRVSIDPNINLKNHAGEKLFIRQILVDTEERAKIIIDRISQGELFEDIASEIDKSLSSVGGFLGYFKKSELHPRIAKALDSRKVFSDPIIVKTELGYHIVQRILPFHFQKWNQLVADARKQSEPATTSARVHTVHQVPSDADAESLEAINEKLNLVSEKKIIPFREYSETRYSTVESTRPTEKIKKYVVFSGAFKDESNAIERLGKLRTLGHPSYRYTKMSPDGPLYMVIAGSYDTLQKAEDAARNIADHGFDYFIKK